MTIKPTPIIWTVNTPVPGLPSVELAEERWINHIIARHGEMAGKEHLVLSTLQSPSVVVRGNPGTSNIVFVNQAEKKSGSTPSVVIVSQPRAFVCTALYDRRFQIIQPELVVWLR